MFNSEDISQIKSKGIDPTAVTAQIERFKNGFPYIHILRPARLEDGIAHFNETEIEKYCQLFEDRSINEQIVKFVPASGAASRMFKKLFAFRNEETPDNDSGFDSPAYFFEHLSEFAFFDELQTLCQKHGVKLSEKKEVLHFLLDSEGMNYGNLPKGLLKFHQKGKHSHTAAEEHLAEGIAYARNKTTVRIHFTLSPEHQETFRKKVEEVAQNYEKKHMVNFIFQFSEQKKSTDTIAVDLQNNPFRNPDGSLLFRPGGHGALIENLNDTDADIIFVKNIDNVVPEHLREDTITYKKLLGGLLLEKRKKVFYYIKKIQSESIQNIDIQEIVNFIKKEFHISVADDFYERKQQEQIDFLLKKLNRPIRICGMVKNEGEPGGGPFFTKNSTGEISLQIVETAQIDPNNPQQQSLLKESTHFNPVDLVLSVKDYQGNPFDLRRYVDPDTGFISQKSKTGQSLKALELPGLWNGAMADWNTCFVEVPISTFNPVKTINDLLRPMHKGEA
ncbi:MAG: NAD metabolism ATPase/kinase [Bacteroidia bacterium]|nr:MAG: NAD metabolism ATPase/kinase [Bacteroidia bacterium]